MISLKVTSRDTNGMNVNRADKIYKLCQDVRNALDLVARHVSHQFSYLW